MISNADKRRMTAAKQIEAAMERKGFSRSQLAEAMGRSRSDVTKWLGGNHNFTNDLLAELSQVLGEEITGVSSLVTGYDEACSDGSVLREPTCGVIYLDSQTYNQAEINASADGMDIISYVRSLISKDSGKQIELPKIDLDKIPGRLAKKYSGYVDYKTAESNFDDERFNRIWNK